MNILVLHGMGEEKNWISSNEDMELMFPKYDKINNYLIHNCMYSVPNVIKKYHFDGILIMSTFFDWVRRYPSNHPWMLQYEFLKDNTAKKIAFDQDSYWLSEIRDTFCVDFKIDLLLPFCSLDKCEELFPKYVANGGMIRQGYAFYVTKAVLDLQKFQVRWEDRAFDIVYRATGQPTYPNKLGHIKGKLGTLFENALSNKSGIKCDFSTKKEKFLRGKAWYNFIANSKAVLGSNPGSDVNIRNFKVVEKLDKIKKSNPEISMDDLVELALDPSDRGRAYDGISPRSVEAAMTGTIQILTPGNYNQLLIPNRHYIPLNEDASNADEVVKKLKDTQFCYDLIQNCRDLFINSKEFSARNIIDEILEFMSENKTNNLITFDNLLIFYKKKLKFIKLRYKFLRVLKYIFSPLRYFYFR